MGVGGSLLGYPVVRAVAFPEIDMPTHLQLAEVLPMLSSFGHAKTILNANASRFGQVFRLFLQE